MNKKQKILIVGAALFAALFLFSGIMLAWQYADGRQSANAFDAVADLIQPVGTPQPGTIPGIGDATEEPDPELIALEKYGAIHEQNSDFVGWISIDGTNINYPVMQTIDKPNFYLKRGFEKQYSNYGVPYVQENCALGISDNVVIYGHHMNNGSMFADLCKYEREDFYQEHPTVSIPCPAWASMRSWPYSKLWPTPRMDSSIIILLMRRAKPLLTLLSASARRWPSMTLAWMRNTATSCSPCLPVNIAAPTAEWSLSPS